MSHSEMRDSKWLWGVEGLRIFLNYVASGVVGIWLSSTSFQKSNINWPPGATEPLILVHFNMIHPVHILPMSIEIYCFLSKCAKMGWNTFWDYKSSGVRISTPSRRISIYCGVCGYEWCIRIIVNFFTDFIWLTCLIS